MSENLKTNNRITWIDNAKAIGIFLVILGHVPYLHNAFKIWIYSFHMPLFFLMAGITFKTPNGGIKELSVKKFNALEKPYFVFSTFALIMGIVQGGYLNDILKLIKKVAGILFFQIRGSELGNDIWFPSCLFISFVLLYYLMKLNKRYGMIIAIISLITGYLYAVIIGQPLPWGIDAALIALFFLYFGNQFSNKFTEYLDKCSKIKLIFVAVVSFALNLIFAVLNYKLSGVRVDMWNCMYGNLVLFLLSAMAGIVGVFTFSRLITYSFVSDFGQNSLYYYGMHQPILVLICSFIPQSNILVNLLTGLLATLFVILILVPFKPIYKKILTVFK